ncbi:MAG TPA: spondin domain-containing protein [Gammaproteobacteria bacterium]|nr:spondin domain-containing protein [Gammaproteobacteria bacterium]
MKRFATVIAGLALGAVGALPMGAASAAEGHAWEGHHQRTYEVTITNLTEGESFTPFLVVSHRSGHPLFTLGQPASAELATLAEGGDTAPLASALSSMAGVGSMATSSGLLAPGHSVTVRIKAGGRFDHLSLAAMMVPTNDGFVSVQNVALPRGRHVRAVTAPAYDAGAEANDELCVHIPGPVCGGEGVSQGITGVGYVHIHSGIHGVGDLNPALYDWRNPVARIVIRRASPH